MVLWPYGVSCNNMLFECHPLTSALASLTTALIGEKIQGDGSSLSAFHF
jgi:hypothetical protein